MYIIVVPNGEHDFFVESADASDRSIETSQELEMALKFEIEGDAKKYMEWVKTPYRIETEEVAVNSDKNVIVVVRLSDHTAFMQYCDHDEAQFAITPSLQLAKRFVNEQSAMDYLKKNSNPDRLSIEPLASFAKS